MLSQIQKIEWDLGGIREDRRCELAAEIELYVKNFVDRRGKNRSPGTFKYRVWDVALSVGKSNARKMSSMVCVASADSKCSP